MLDRIAVAVVVSLTLSPSIGAQNCEALIGLSKVVSTVVSDKSSVEKHAENFCSEYSRSKASGGSTSFGVSYKFLSASLGRSDTSAEAVAAKYCSASNLEKAAVDAYQQYVETIAPNAYASYESCIAAGQSVRFGDATVLPEELGLSMSFVGLSTADTQATLSFVASRDVTCTWDAARANRVTVRAGGTAKLTCNRRDASRQSFVLISRVDGTQSRGFQINWRKYDKDGNVVDSVAALQARIEGVEQRVVALAAPPSAVEASCRPESYWMACFGRAW